MRQTQRAILPETTMETNNLPAKGKSRFPLSSDELLKETLKRAENNNTQRSTRNVDGNSVFLGKVTQDASVETIKFPHSDEVLPQSESEIPLGSSKQEPESLKHMKGWYFLHKERESRSAIQLRSRFILVQWPVGLSQWSASRSVNVKIMSKH